MSDIKTKEWAERVGRAAANAGFPLDMDRHKWFNVVTDDPKLNGSFADFRDSLTEKAAELWVEATAQETYEGRVCVNISRWFDRACIQISVDGKYAVGGFRDTMAEACIECMRDMGGKTGPKCSCYAGGPIGCAVPGCEGGP